MGEQYDYDLFQQIYCLSMITGIVSNKHGSEETLENAMKQALGEALPHLKGNWNVSWGPRVYQENDPYSDFGGPDNVWFAAIDETQKICVVAIAGTVFTQWADIYQDFNIIHVVNFSDWVKRWTPEGIPKPQASIPLPGVGSRAPFCAQGTCVGVWNIVNNADTRQSSGTRIDEYLRSLDSSYTIVVAGHSLGGALAPMVALGLVQADLVGNNKTVKVLPSAGVSPGNAELAALYSANFPRELSASTGYRVFNTDYYNVYDIVPQAWSPNPGDDRNLHNIVDNILHFNWTFKWVADFLLKQVVGLSQLSGIQYSPLPGDPFTGPPPPAKIESFGDIGAVITKEHIKAYHDEIGISEFLDRFEDGLLMKLRARRPSTT
ncbi:hypothetical protein GGS24DRAFT_500450 [Hypoxylon argillaceum]|nr:hypothetical protein GGS24DRAFT_500450 [Hypoxylon argillaceum]KAI1145735.1 hypothetical protein F4825DRAFT_457202 [Nemania diffusa]